MKLDSPWYYINYWRKPAYSAFVKALVANVQKGRLTRMDLDGIVLCAAEILEKEAQEAGES
jgi:hypothetical protein